MYTYQKLYRNILTKASFQKRRINVYFTDNFSINDQNINAKEAHNCVLHVFPSILAYMS